MEDAGTCSLVAMLMRFLLFLAVFLSVFGGAHALVGARLASLLGLVGGARIALWTLLGLLGASSIAAQFVWRANGPGMLWSDALVRIGLVWMGFVLLLFVGAVSGEILALPLRFVPATRAAVPWIQAGALCLALAGGLAGLVGAARPPRIHEVELRVQGLPAAFDGYRIAHLTDTHVGPTLRRAWGERLVARIDSARPDLIAFTGDFVDGSVEQLRSEVAPFASLSARDGVVFVTGNHDVYSGGESWRAVARGFGWSVVDRSSTLLERAGERIVVAGLPDPQEARGAKGLAPDVPDGFRLLLAHRPAQALDVQGMGIGLQLSGHTHGGQVWPFHLLVRSAEPVVAGYAVVGDVPVFVSCGAGFWGPPMRLFARSEVPILVLRRA